MKRADKDKKSPVINPKKAATTTSPGMAAPVPHRKYRKLKISGCCRTLQGLQTSTGALLAWPVSKTRAGVVRRLSPSRGSVCQRTQQVQPQHQELQMKQPRQRLSPPLET